MIDEDTYLPSWFLPAVAVVDDDVSCWEWTRRRDRNNYGIIVLLEHDRGAHRLSYELAIGPITSERPYILHKCDNPPCVRPSHLWAGTPKENSQDMIRKGRGKNFSTPRLAVRGETHHNATLTEVQVKSIRADFAEGVLTKAEILKKYNVKNYDILGAILRGKTWKHLL